MTPEIFDRNYNILKNYKIGDNVLITTPGIERREFGTIVGYDAHNGDRKVMVIVEVFTYPRLRYSDSIPRWKIDTDQATTLEVL